MTELRFKDVAATTTLAFWLQNLILFLFFQGYSVYVLVKVKSLSRSNYATILTFNLILLIKLVFLSILFFDVTDQGRALIDIDDRLIKSEIQLVYFFSIFDNLMDFFLICIFYNIVFNMWFVWMQLFHENMVYQFEEAEDEDSRLQLFSSIVYSEKCLQNMKLKRIVFFVVYTILNATMIINQFLFVYGPKFSVA